MDYLLIQHVQSLLQCKLHRDYLPPMSTGSLAFRMCIYHSIPQGAGQVLAAVRLRPNQVRDPVAV